MNPPKLLIDDTVIVGPFTTIGHEGFHFTRDKNNKLTHGEHKFGVILHKDVWLGSHVTVARGRWRDTVIGEGTKVDDHAHISHNVVIGKNCIIATGTSILGSVTIGDNCEIWTGVILHQGITIGDNSVVGAGTYLRHDLGPNLVAYDNTIKEKENSKKYFQKREGEGSRKTDCLNGSCKSDTSW